MPPAESVGYLHGDVPYLKIGHGPPLVMVLGLTPEHDVTLDAEDVFDVEDHLALVAGPTLVVGGSNDVAYAEDLFRRTAAGVQDGRAHVFPGWGHMRASTSTATTHLTLGFMLAGLPLRGAH